MQTETKNAEQIWRYIFRALGAVFSFFMYDTYQQVREIKTGVDDLKIMVAETKKDVQTSTYVVVFPKILHKASR